ncbi:MAG: phosphate ABC transporter permease family protein, partial [Gammaproteobacteria bacterium]
MSVVALLFTLVLLGLFSYWLGRKRSYAVVNGDAWKLHSLPSYHGFYAAIWCGIPALLVAALWLFFEDTIITNLVIAGLPDDVRNL